MILCIGPRGGLRAVTVKGTPNSSTAATVTIPAHAIGDIIVIHAFRDNTTLPSVPSAGGTVPTWTQIDSLANDINCSGRLYYAVATANNHTSGTWTNATAMSAIVLTGQGSTPIGGHGVAKSGATQAVNYTPTAPSITLVNTDGTSAILEVYGYGNGFNNAFTWGAAPTGYTRLTSTSGSTGNGSCVNSKNSTTSDGSSGQTENSNGQYNAGTVSHAVEIRQH